MNFPRTTFCVAALSALLALGACSMPAPMGDGMPDRSTGNTGSTGSSAAMGARLSGAEEVPANNSAGRGMADIALNRQTNVLTWTVTYSGVSSPVTAGHFHGPALAGQNAGVVLPFSGSMASPISGSATLTAAQVADLSAGKWYVNLHTAANPGGELRGQVTGRP